MAPPQSGGSRIFLVQYEGKRFRIDHAFLSATLAARAGSIRYSHDERLAGLSDHSPRILDLGT